MGLKLEDVVAAYVVGAVRVQLGDLLVLLDVPEASHLHRQLGEALALASQVTCTRQVPIDIAWGDTEPAPPGPDTEVDIYIEVEDEAPIDRRA